MRNVYTDVQTGGSDPCRRRKFWPQGHARRHGTIYARRRLSSRQVATATGILDIDAKIGQPSTAPNNQNCFWHKGSNNRNVRDRSRISSKADPTTARHFSHRRRVLVPAVAGFCRAATSADEPAIDRPTQMASDQGGPIVRGEPCRRLCLCHVSTPRLAA